MPGNMVRALHKFLGVAANLLGRNDQVQRYTWVLAARFEALRLRGANTLAARSRAFALTLQHDPKTALEMALRNWQVQRTPWDARVVLEAALSRGGSLGSTSCRSDGGLRGPLGSSG
jgi:hypothetical protein